MTGSYDIMSVGLSDSTATHTNTQRSLTVTDIKVKSVNDTFKVVFDVMEETTGKIFSISDVWVKHQGVEKVQGLWYTPGESVRPFSSLGKLLVYHNAEKIGDLNGKVLTAFPDKDNFLVLTTYDKTA